MLVFPVMGISGQDSRYTESSAMSRHRTEPGRALVMIDSAVMVGNISWQRGEYLKAVTQYGGLHDMSLAAQTCLNMLVNDVATNGPAQEDLSKVVENLYKKRAENKEENSFWISAMSDFVEDNINIDAEFDAIVKSITPQTIADFAKEVLKGYNKEVVQMPTK